MFARYNAWANRRLYAAAALLPEADYRADQGAFFGSLMGTLNHILVGDRIWMRRFTGDGPAHAALDAIVAEPLGELTRLREAEDARILAYVEGLAPERFAETFTYRMIVNPIAITQPLAPALAHFFNHQTHHRGQAHTLVTRVAGPDAVPPLDLIMFQRETGIGLS
jgi:uncharacterized damage-inducible protein DinB